jgi:hypothetical protein
MGKLRVGAVAGLAACIAMSVLAGAAVRPPRLRHCGSLDVGSVHVSKIRANYACAAARNALRRLLSDGIDSLPKASSTRSRWVCHKYGARRICKQRSRRRVDVARRIVFRASTVHAESGPAPAPTPPPAPAPAPAPTPGPQKTPPPQDCLDYWNALASHNFPDDGMHFYVDHNIRQGWVFHMTDGTSRCAVVFVDPASDPYPWEFGTDGEVRDTNGTWLLMNEVFPNAIEVQGQAPANANVSLDATGNLTSL